MGVKTQFHMDGEDAILNSIQNVEPILRYCAAARSLGQTGSSEMKHAAKIPRVLVEEYRKRNGISMHEFMANDDHIRRLLEDPALSQFRIWQGKV